MARLGIDGRAGPAAVAFEQWLELFRRLWDIAGPGGMRAVAGAERRLRRRQATQQRLSRIPVRNPARRGSRYR